MNRALTLIKAISKKKEATIAAERPNFMAGAKANGIAEEDGARLFELILKFAGYGFNKAHSTRYAIVAYQSAWFKVHYPRQFMAATLTFEASDTDKLNQYLDECEVMGIKVGPPNINQSEADFTVVGQDILFGLAGIKGVGDKAVEAILASRSEAKRFEDLYNFCENVDLRAVNHATLEALIKCGAFDGMGAHRAAMVAALDGAIQHGQQQASDRRSGQMSFFTAFETSPAGRSRPQFPNVEPWTEAKLLAAEKETLGFYITSHPLTSYGRELDTLGSAKLAGLRDMADGTPVTIGCMVSQVRPRLVRQGRSAGQKMAMLTVEDLTGSADCVIFSDAFERVSNLLTPEAMVFLLGSVDRRREEPNIVVDDVIPIAQASEKLTGSVEVKVDAIWNDPARMQELHDVLLAFRGSCPVDFRLHPSAIPHLEAWVRADTKWFVSPKQALMKRLAAFLGEENVVFRGKPATSGRRNNNGWRGRDSNGGNGPRGQSEAASPAVTRFN